MVTVCINGQTVVNLKVTGKKIKSRGTESTIGRMVEFMKDTGIKIICMDKGCINGQMEDNMKETMLMTKKMGMVFIRTLMVDAIKDNGRMENNTVKGYL